MSVCAYCTYRVNRDVEEMLSNDVVIKFCFLQISTTFQQKALMVTSQLFKSSTSESSTVFPWYY